jgi:uncharacterized protein (DUF169 family)
MSKTQKYNLDDYQKCGEQIFHKLHLASHPIAVKYIKNLSEIPENVSRPNDKGLKMSICQAFTESRRFSKQLCITAEDNFCSPSVINHGWVNLDQDEYIDMQMKQDWFSNTESEGKFIRNEYRNTVEKNMKLGYIGVMSAPLNETTFVPDTVLIYGNGKQMTYIIQALCYEKIQEYTITSSFAGYTESCGKTLKAFVNQKPEFIIPGKCDREVCLIQDEEVAIGMQPKAAFYIAETLFSTGRRRGLKMPLRQVMPRLTEEISPGYLYARELVDKIKDEKKQ